MPRPPALAIPLVFVLACAPAAAPLAPVPPGSGKSLYYFPTRVGTKWVYDKTFGGAPWEGYAKVITESEEKNGRYLVTVKTTSVDFVDTDATTIGRFEVSRDGFFKVAEGLESEETRLEFDPPRCYLKLPHRVGEKWGANPRDGELPWVAGEVETVKVPAGTFEAIRVDCGKNSFWYAPGVGCIKGRRGDTRFEMKSFTLPKD